MLAFDFQLCRDKDLDGIKKEVAQIKLHPEEEASAALSSVGQSCPSLPPRRPALSSPLAQRPAAVAAAGP